MCTLFANGTNAIGSDALDDGKKPGVDDRTPHDLQVNGARMPSRRPPIHCALRAGRLPGNAARPPAPHRLPPVRRLLRAARPLHARSRGARSGSPHRHETARQGSDFDERTSNRRSLLLKCWVLAGSGQHGPSVGRAPECGLRGRARSACAECVPGVHAASECPECVRTPSPLPPLHTWAAPARAIEMGARAPVAAALAFSTSGFDGAAVEASALSAPESLEEESPSLLSEERPRFFFFFVRFRFFLSSEELEELSLLSLRGRFTEGLLLPLPGGHVCAKV